MKRLCLALFLFLLLPLNARAAESVIAGHDAVWPPFEFHDENNQIVGYGVDYLNAVAKEAGFSVTSVQVPWDGIFTRLKQGDIRIICSSVTITEERKKNMDFSDPYFETTQVLLLPANSTAAKLADLKNPVFGVQTGTTAQPVANSHKGLIVRPYDELPEAVADLAAGKIDGVIADAHVAAHFPTMPAYKGKMKLAPFSITDEKELYGFVVKKGDTEMLEKINAGMAALKRKGIDKEIYAKWFEKGKAGQ